MSHILPKRGIALVASVLMLGLALPCAVSASVVTRSSTSCTVNAAPAYVYDSGDLCEADAEYFHPYGGTPAANAGATGSVTASPGDLTLFLVATARAYDQFYAGAVVTGFSAFRETLTIGAGSTLAPGAPVELRLNHRVGYTLQQQVENHTIVAGGIEYTSIVRNSGFLRSIMHLGILEGQGDSLSYTDDNTVNAFRDGESSYSSNPGVFWTVVGATLEFTHQFTGECRTFVEQPAQNQPYSTYGRCTLSATGSSHAYIDVLTDGAFLASESGHNYSLPFVPGATDLPEPGALGLLVAGIAALRVVRARAIGLKS